MNEKLVKRFLELCVIPGPSRQERPVADRIGEELKALGLEAREDGAAAPVGGEAGNLLVELPPEGEPRRWVTLLAHMDAVPPGYSPAPYLDGDALRTREGILAADDRAGAAIALQVLEDLRERPLQRTAVQVIFTVSEEAGPSGADALDPGNVRGEFAVVLDTGGHPGQFNVASPEARKFSVAFRGRGAHAGIEPEKGVNALLMAARVAAEIPSGRISSDTTFNFTILNAGTGTNVVPEEAVLQGEVRSYTAGEADRLLQNLALVSERVASEAGGRCEIALPPMFARFEIPLDHPLVERLSRVATELGFQPEPRRSGGGSDANPLNAKGIPSVNLAVGYHQGHGPEEHLVLSEFDGTYRWVSQFLRDLDGEKG